MASQQLILGLIAIAILVILLIPTLIIKTRKERKLPGEPKPGDSAPCSSMSFA